MPRLPRPAGIAMAVLALSVLATAPASGGEPALSDARLVAHFDFAAGRTPENIALERDGSADLTFAFARQVANVTRQGTTRILATLPSVANAHTPLVRAAMVLGIARAHDGTLYVTYATGTAKTGVWRIARGGGAPRQIAKLPADSLPNGLALDEHRGVLYAADSVLGTVWRIPRSGGKAVAWAKGAALTPARAPAEGVGANGIKVHGHAVWVSNTDRGTLLRIPVRPDDTAGAVEKRATGLAGIDDFAFTGRGHTVLAALISSNRVALVRPDGTHTEVLARQAGLSNPTAVAVRDRTVYVTGGAYYTMRDPNLLIARLHRGFDR
ncbi:SMP-30/gluconolactonase/LRE family protein [Streptomyces sp. NPDC054794]